MNKIIIYKSKILKNFQHVKEKTNAKICAVVKCNGYGLGANQIVRCLKNHADFFAVASLEEAINLRKKFKEIKILILGKCSNYIKAIKNNISVSIDNINELKIIKKLKINKIINIHIKINTGMNRLGINSIWEFSKIFNIINNNIIIEGIYTHFATAKNDDEYFNMQLNRFNNYIKAIPKNISSIIHLGGGAVANYEAKYDMIRVGLDLYIGENKNNLIFKLYSKVISIKNIKKGERVGYDNSFIASKKMKVAVINIGYGDGISQHIVGLNCEINKNKYPIIGKLCMDMLFVQVDENVKVGDSVNMFLDIVELSRKTEQSEYKILTDLNSCRCKRMIRS